MMLQRLATGATGVKQARYRRRPTRGSEALVRACAVYTQRECMGIAPWLLLTAYEFRHFSAFMNIIFYAKRRFLAGDHASYSSVASGSAGPGVLGDLHSGR